MNFPNCVSNLFVICDIVILRLSNTLIPLRISEFEKAFSNKGYFLVSGFLGLNLLIIFNKNLLLLIQTLENIF